MGVPLRQCMERRQEGRTDVWESRQGHQEQMIGMKALIEKWVQYFDSDPLKVHTYSESSAYQ